MKAGFFKLNKEVDAQKTVAGYFSAGYIMTKTRIIGQMSKDHIVARNIEKRTGLLFGNISSMRVLKGFQLKPLVRPYSHGQMVG